MAILNHIKKRLDNRPNIQLPMTSLMEILNNPSSPTIVKVRVQYTCTCTYNYQ